MRYQYIGNDHYYVGLPACDIDDNELTADQRDQLKTAIAAGLYRLAEPEMKSPSFGGKDNSHEEEGNRDYAE